MMALFGARGRDIGDSFDFTFGEGSLGRLEGTRRRILPKQDQSALPKGAELTDKGRQRAVDQGIVTDTKSGTNTSGSLGARGEKVFLRSFLGNTRDALGFNVREKRRINPGNSGGGQG